MSVPSKGRPVPGPTKNPPVPVEDPDALVDVVRDDELPAPGGSQPIDFHLPALPSDPFAIDRWWEEVSERAWAIVHELEEQRNDLLARTEAIRAQAEGWRALASKGAESFRLFFTALRRIDQGKLALSRSRTTLEGNRHESA